MIPYADFLYFGVLLYVAVPTLLLRAAWRTSHTWILLTTFVMLAVQYTGRWTGPDGQLREVWLVLGYAAFQWLVARTFLFLRPRTPRQLPYYAALVLALAPLLVAKLLPLVRPGTEIGFLGISYVSFRALDVIFSIQDRLIVSLPPGQLAAFLLFFPTISSGPIDRYRRFAEDWKRFPTRAGFVADLDAAVHLVFTGFLYKFILAALVKQYWLDPAAAGAGWTGVVSFMYAYAFYLFFDFAGYSAFAIAVSSLLGVHTPANFNRPFLARNIRDFWNRWHMSLSFWFRDHVYMRFVLAATKGRWFKSKHTASYLALFLSFGLMGLWHGTQAHYLLYGAYQASLMVGFDLFERWNKTRKVWGDGPLWRLAGTVLTFHAVCFGFLLFSGHLGPSWGLTPTGPTALAGRLEQADAEYIRGWAWDRARPGKPVSVAIYDGQKLLATVVADRDQSDLDRPSREAGPHGFRLLTPATLKDGVPHSIRVTIAGTYHELKGSPRLLVATPAVQSMEGLDGSLEAATFEEISGWAWDGTRPDAVVEVDILDGQSRLATVRADELRQDLAGAGKGNGRHGFVFRMPPTLKDGQVHVIWVRVAKSGFNLDSSPRLLKPGG